MQFSREQAVKGLFLVNLVVFEMCIPLGQGSVVGTSVWNTPACVAVRGARLSASSAVLWPEKLEKHEM